MADTVEFTAKLVSLHKENVQLEPLQMPLVVDENLSMVMQFKSTGQSPESMQMKVKELVQFERKFKLFKEKDLPRVLSADDNLLFSVMSRVVPCVGCRRSIERLYNEVKHSGGPVLDPVYIDMYGYIRLDPRFTYYHKSLCALFHKYGSKLNPFVDSISKTKKNRRCVLHTLDSQKVRPAGVWLDVWELMSKKCKEEVVIVEQDTLLETLESYLKKHRFCGECKTKVMTAYHLLVEEADSTKEKGYVASLYEGIRYCSQERHVHAMCDTDFVASLMSRAEPELRGSIHREKHAKTIDVAQEEVLVCIGICLYERLHRISQRMREEEQTWQLMFYLGVECVKTNFELNVEKMLGVSKLELLCEELRVAELAKYQKQEHKRQKRRRRKNKLKDDASTDVVNQCHSNSASELDESCSSDGSVGVNEPIISTPPLTTTTSSSSGGGSPTSKTPCPVAAERRRSNSQSSSTNEQTRCPFPSPTNVLPNSVFELPSIRTLNEDVSTMSTCSCSSNECVSCCVDVGYHSGSILDSPCSSPSSCDCETTFVDTCCNRGDENKSPWKSNVPRGCSNNHSRSHKHSPSTGTPQKILPSVCDSDEYFKACSFSPSLEDQLKKSSPSEEESYIPPEELREMKAKLNGTLQERQKFRENLRQQFQDLHKSTKFRFRPMSAQKLLSQFEELP